MVATAWFGNAEAALTAAIRASSPPARVVAAGWVANAHAVLVAAAWVVNKGSAAWIVGIALSRRQNSLA